MRIVVITGTRLGTRSGAAWAYLDAVSPEAVIAGGATGIDTEARLWTQRRAAFLIEVPAPWRPKEPRKDGLTYDPTAGMRRNEFMVAVALALKAHGHDVTAAAFPDEKSRGTHDCIRKLKAAGIPVEKK